MTRRWRCASGWLRGWRSRCRPRRSANSRHTKLRLTPGKVLLDVPRRREALAGEPVQKRLGALAAALDRKGEILIG